ncbi:MULTISPECIES: fimbrial protein [Xenorhabdus]|uniref:Long polar fimbrial protein LpfA n=1 Tax=Xenorhabdus ehlersii TaxID=290111 RepID=A0A2D0IWK4_9GAMM|nr:MULTISPECIES: fimbrial protein [Xenorhabdus]MBC8950393.1 long polar fimbrial protein LpfA [Xenorhabdus sp. TS4]PHM26291.1 long polar fimbrial protein LpfA [Xenorhabdus ehlersii]RKE91542.1 major type 1 subunit fimbrin (pilin) [Xenorhabdus ehlersii]
MKNILVSSFIAAILVSVSSISYAAFPVTTGSVKFHGDIVESTCNSDVSGNIVNMGTYHMSDIGKKGTEIAGSKKPFSIKLTGCPVTTTPLTMEVTLSGSTLDSVDNRLLALDGLSGTAAAGIGIGIYNSTGKQIDLSSSPKLPIIEINEADMKIPLQVAYVSNGQSVKAGKADATLNFSINYK